MVWAWAALPAAALRSAFELGRQYWAVPSIESVEVATTRVLESELPCCLTSADS